jgi:nitrogen regulatory protein P-II 1
MKKIEAIIRTHKLEDLRSALEEMGVLGMTITEVRGFGRQKGHHELYRGREYHVAFVPKIKIELMVRSEDLESIIEKIRDVCATGQVGDGKIFVYDINDSIRIRTGERGNDAL